MKGVVPSCFYFISGTLCEIDINECEPLPCDNVGTEENGCVNLINDFRCRCKAGYTGKQCEVSTRLSAFSFLHVIKIIRGLFNFLQKDLENSWP